MKKIVITGGGGVFGNHFVKYLLDNSLAESVISIGRSPYPSSPFSLDVGLNDPRFQYIQLHLSFERERLWNLFCKEKPSVVVNFSALAYATSWDEPHLYFDTNVTAVAYLVDKLQHVDWFDRFVQIGTSELYGSVSSPASELSPVNPTSPYAVSKLAADMFLDTMHRTRGFPMNILRPSNAYGPGQLLYRVIPRAVYAALTNCKLPLQGGGMVKKSYMHAVDIAQALSLIIQKAPLGETYNVGPKDPVSIGEIVRSVIQKCGKDPQEIVEVTPGRLGEDAVYWLDSSKIINSLGYRETISLNRGLDQMVEWGRKYLPQLPAPTDFKLRA